jgi:Na+-driven multidrug efflux pump
MRISFPSWAEGILLWGGQYLIVFFVNAMNDKALAKLYNQDLEKISGLTMSVHSNVLRVEMFAFLPGFGIGMATAALVGQSLGAKRPDLARRATMLSTRLALIAMTVLALPMVFIPNIMMRLMVNNSHAAEIGYWPMILAGLAQPGFAIAIIMASALKGAGDTFSVMVSTLLGMFAVRIPIVFGIIWLFNSMGHPTWGLTAVWITIFIDLNFRAVYNTILFKRGKWATQKV